MKQQYLIVAEQISFRNNRLSVINVWDQFSALHLPAKFNFDLAFICGPNWDEGEYELKFKVRAGDKESVELGTVKAEIKNKQSVFNAIANNLNFLAEKGAESITFEIEVDGRNILEREYPISYLLELKKKEEDEVEVSVGAEA